MKKIMISLVTLFIASTTFADALQNDLRAQEDFVATCPEQFLTYLDTSEGGPGAYCACPDENISYLDKAEGGIGAYCTE